MKLDEKWLREHLPEDIRDEDLNYWQLDSLCHFLGKADKTGTWRWFLEPHWAYDEEKLRFIEISDSREYRSDSDKTDAVTQDNVIGLVD